MVLPLSFNRQKSAILDDCGLPTHHEREKKEETSLIISTEIIIIPTKTWISKWIITFERRVTLFKADENHSLSWLSPWKTTSLSSVVFLGKTTRASGFSLRNKRTANVVFSTPFFEENLGDLYCHKEWFQIKITDLCKKIILEISKPRKNILFLKGTILQQLLFSNTYRGKGN